MVSHASPPYEGCDTRGNSNSQGYSRAPALSNRTPQGALNGFRHVLNDPTVHFVMEEWKHLLSTLHRFRVLSAASFLQTERRGKESWHTQDKGRRGGLAAPCSWRFKLRGGSSRFWEREREKSIHTTKYRLITGVRHLYTSPFFLLCRTRRISTRDVGRLCTRSLIPHQLHRLEQNQLNNQRYQSKDVSRLLWTLCKDA